jgi:undecaprenyl-diphosphatase
VAGLLVVSVGLRALSRPLEGDDLAIVRAVARHRTAGLTAAAHAVSWLGRTWVLLALAAIVTGVVARRTRTRVDPTLIVVVIGAFALQNLAKALSDRPRPPVTHLEHVTSSSFPSGHALQSAAFATALCLMLAAGAPPRRVLLCAALGAGLVVIAVAVSRVYLGVHYPTDVAAGVLLGVGWGALAVAVCRPCAGPVS